VVVVVGVGCDFTGGAALTTGTLLIVAVDLGGGLGFGLGATCVFSL